MPSPPCHPNTTIIPTDLPHHDHSKQHIDWCSGAFSHWHCSHWWECCWCAWTAAIPWPFHTCLYLLHAENIPLWINSVRLYLAPPYLPLSFSSTACTCNTCNEAGGQYEVLYCTLQQYLQTICIPWPTNNTVPVCSSGLTTYGSTTTTHNCLIYDVHFTIEYGDQSLSDNDYTAALTGIPWYQPAQSIHCATPQGRPGLKCHLPAYHQ